MSDRDNQGRFLPGNTYAKGNPFHKQVAQLRSVLYDAVSEEDMRKVIRKLVSMAIDGDTAAIKLLLDRCLGSVRASIEITQQEPDYSKVTDYSELSTAELKRIIAEEAD